MNIRIKNLKNKVIYSLLISLGIHLILLVWSLFVKISLYSSGPDKKPRFINVKISSEEKPGEKKQDPKEQAVDSPYQPSADDKPSFVSVDQKEIVKTDLDIFDSEKANPVVNADKSGALKLINVERKEVEINKTVRRATRKRLVEAGEIPQENFVSGAPAEISGDQISKNYLEKSLAGMAGRDALPVTAKRNDNTFSLMKNYAPGLKRQTIVSDLGDTLSYELYTYKDPKDNQQYFKISIKVKTVAPNLPSIPKEIIFVIDASNSIGEKRLEQFKKGVMYSLDKLNPQDYFNIVVFKDTVFSFNDKPLIRNDDNIKKALVFINKITSSAKTDMYGALKESLHLESTFKPSYRFVLSDGFPTKGVTDSRQVINAIADLNKGKVPIFALGGGVSISKYMIDFIAYKNRGWASYTGREHQIAQAISAFYDSIRDPILLRPRYYISGINEFELYPKILPDFFRGAEFVLYGIYADEDKFYLQLLGDLIGQTKQITVQGALKEAQPGDKEIAKQWAFHKVYYLISQLKHDAPNEEVLKEIDALSTKFNIVTPYSRNFRK